VASSNAALAPALAAEVESRLEARIRRASPVSGGDINAAHRLELFDGRHVFLKSNAQAPPGMFEAEARGLAWLRAPQAIQVPRVLAIGRAYLALEWIDSGRSSGDFEDRLGRRLAELHRASPGAFGLDHANFIGSLPQANPEHASFASFLRHARLLPQFERAQRTGHFDAATSARFERLLAHIENYLGPNEPPARLHGDLWSGNVLVGSTGEPYLIDPAAYGGHREMDLAMLRLFGGFSERLFDAYADAFPLEPGHVERVPLMQLYPLLVHVNLFGSGYVPAVRRVLDRYSR
jgi:fructosamine-3-kinase